MGKVEELAMLIVLDSNPLHGRADPGAASDIKPLLSLAAQLKIGVAVPEACLIELREGMRDKLADAQKGLNNAVAKLKQLQVEIVAPPVGDVAALLQYEARLQEFLRKHNIAVLPFPQRVPDVRTLFDLAARKQPPFDSAGNNYRDAMVVLSVEDHLRRTGVDSVAFVTKDARFQQAFASEKVTCRNVEEMLAELKTSLSAEQQGRREKIRKAVAAALASRLGEITARASGEATFDVPTDDLWAKLVSIDSFVATGVRSVEPGEIRDESAEFTAKVQGDLSFTVTVPDFAQRVRQRTFLEEVLRPRKVGDTGGESELPPHATITTSLWPQFENVKTSVTLALDGIATLDRERVTNVLITGLRHEPGNSP